MQTADLVSSIKKKLLISTFIGRFVHLKKSGQGFLGLCPFHEEKTPSFHVRDTVGRFKCFGCGASGDVFDFLIKLRGLSFQDAINELAREVGVVKHNKRVISPKKENPYFKAHKIAHNYFMSELFKKDGRAALSYLVKKRGLTEVMIKQAQIGFAGNNDIGLIRALKNHGISKKIAVECGLIKITHEKITSIFKNRIVFPIKNGDGHTIAFGGRSINEGELPKYINTKAYKYYEKQTNFYGLSESKQAILKGAPLYLVEGYFDALAFWAVGFPALCVCGTALSANHVGILKRLTNNVIIAFDADEAGLNAMKKALAELFKNNISPRALSLDEHDAGEYLKKGLLEKLREKTKHNQDAFCFVINGIGYKGSLDISAHLLEIESVLPIFDSIKRPIVKRQYASYLAKVLNEDPSIIWQEINKRGKRNFNNSKGQKTKKTSASLGREELLISLLVHFPNLAKCFNDSDKKNLSSSSALFLSKLLSMNLDDCESSEIIAAAKSSSSDLYDFVKEQLLHDPIHTNEEAKQIIIALKEKLNQRDRDLALQQKRMELVRAAEGSDFDKVKKNLKEYSEMLKTKKLKNSSNEKKESNKLSIKHEFSPAKTIEKDKKFDESLAALSAEDDWL